MIGRKYYEKQGVAKFSPLGMKIKVAEMCSLIM